MTYTCVATGKESDGYTAVLERKQDGIRVGCLYLYQERYPRTLDTEYTVELCVKLD